MYFFFSSETISPDIAFAVRYAPAAPNPARPTLLAAHTATILAHHEGTNTPDSSGRRAPNANASADASAACVGLGSASRAASSRSVPSRLSWDTSMSYWAYTDTNSPMAMLHAPATSPARPDTSMALPVAFTAPTPIMREATETSPSLAPRTAARSHCARAM
nr:unnamed protein product [Digitaria exilis]